MNVKRPKCGANCCAIRNSIARAMADVSGEFLLAAASEVEHTAADIGGSALFIPRQVLMRVEGGGGCGVYRSH
jgi:hypothetical protein